MYHLRTFKLFDLIIQLVLVVTLFCYGNATGEGWRAFILGLFIVGGWQVLSCLVHLIALPRPQRGSGRTIYEWALLVSALLIILCWPLIALFLWVGPFMALWYFVACLAETLHFSRPPKPTYC